MEHDVTNPYQSPRTIKSEPPRTNEQPDRDRRARVWLRAMVPYLGGIWTMNCAKGLWSPFLGSLAEYFRYVPRIALEWSAIPALTLYCYLVARTRGKRLFRPWILFALGIGYYFGTVKFASLWGISRAMSDNPLNIASYLVCVIVGAEIAIITSRPNSKS